MKSTCLVRVDAISDKPSDMNGQTRNVSLPHPQFVRWVVVNVEAIYRAEPTSAAEVLMEPGPTVDDSVVWVRNFYNEQSSWIQVDRSRVRYISYDSTAPTSKPACLVHIDEVSTSPLSKGSLNHKMRIADQWFIASLNMIHRTETSLYMLAEPGPAFEASVWIRSFDESTTWMRVDESRIQPIGYYRPKPEPTHRSQSQPPTPKTRGGESGDYHDGDY